MDRVRFIVAESSYLIRKGIVSIINRIEHATVVKETDTLNEINSLIGKYDPNYLALNLELFTTLKSVRNSRINIDLSTNGIAISNIYPSNPSIINNFNEIIYLRDSKEEIFEKITKLVRLKSTSKIIPGYIQNLSEREKTILKHVAKGLTNKEIADELFLSSHTVIAHRKNITAKLGIKTISGLTVYAILNNIISMDELKS